MFRSVWNLLEKSDKIRFVTLVIGILLTSIMNIGGVASVMPFIEVLTTSGNEITNPVVAEVFTRLGIQMSRATIVWMGIGVMALFLVGNSLLALVTWKSIVFARAVAYGLTTRLFARYLRQPYSFYLNHNTSELMKNLFGEINSIINGVLKPLVELMVEGVLALALVVFLVIVDPIIALAALALLGGGYGLIFVVFRRMLNRASKTKVRRNRDRYRVVSDAFGAIKELKLLSLERRYIELYDGISNRFEIAKGRIQGIAKLPRYALEALAFGGILGLALVLFVRGGSATSVLPLMSAYAVAGYKLLPALQRVFAAFAHIRGSHASTELVVHELRRAAPPLAPVMGPETVPFGDAIDLQNVTFNYEGTQRPALTDISLKIRKNTTVGIVGPTGCGKTTLVDVILGLHTAQSGTITVDGNRITTDNLSGWQRHFGYVPQFIYLSDTSVTRNIAFGVPDEEIDHERVRFAAQLANLHDFVLSLDDGYETQLGERGVRLSGGQRQRVGIARALYRDPDILVFDEATSALDTHTEIAVMDAIAKLMHEKTIIIIAHRLSTLRDADNIFVLRDGRIEVEGTYADLSTTHPHFLNQEPPRQ